MAYTKTYWDELTAITAGLLNKIETGITEAHDWDIMHDNIMRNYAQQGDFNKVPVTWADIGPRGNGDQYGFDSGTASEQIRNDGSHPLVVQLRTDDPDPATAYVGMIYLRTDL
ncbi:hypothetical protein [Cytobacillus sp. NCCP-133]|uniref:hypothetical protein n=1 Tax=Cytobacillus sp. NCCP-133 TaxID=766848 RepID=UPI00223095CE|nr:hypothetical protein [Cytobacillus sp. NCCP-133]GLB58681.1 hypothetical protein NCCP133_08140 [Cytobacillus sp. NCCP-133]